MCTSEKNKLWEVQDSEIKGGLEMKRFVILNMLMLYWIVNIVCPLNVQTQIPKEFFVTMLIMCIICYKRYLKGVLEMIRFIIHNALTLYWIVNIVFPPSNVQIPKEFFVTMLIMCIICYKRYYK